MFNFNWAVSKSALGLILTETEFNPILAHLCFVFELIRDPTWITNISKNQFCFFFAEIAYLCFSNPITYSHLLSICLCNNWIKVNVSFKLCILLWSWCQNWKWLFNMIYYGGFRLNYQVEVLILLIKVHLLVWSHIRFVCLVYSFPLKVFWIFLALGVILKLCSWILIGEVLIIVVVKLCFCWSWVLLELISFNHLIM